MNTGIVIIIVSIFALIGEVFTWLTQSDTLFVRVYVSVMRIATIALAICAIWLATIH